MKLFTKKLSKSNLFFVAIILFASVLASLPLLRADFFHFSDEPHIANLYQMVRALGSGQIPPRWAPDMSYEFGYPLFNFYYVLPFYIASAFYLLGGSLILSLKLTFLLTIPLSGLFMFLWLKKHTDSWTATVGSVVYIFSPYRAVDLYVRGAIGEAVAFVFFPLIMWAIFKVFEKIRLRYVSLLALISGLFFLSHNLAPIIFLPFALIYALVLGYNFKSFRNFVRVLLGVILGFGLASFFVVPAFVEKSLLNTQTPFNYWDHFPFIKQLIYSPFRYGASNPGMGDDISFQLGIINIVLFFASLFFIRKATKTIKRLYLVFAASFAACLFLMNIRSTFLWEAFSLSAYIQFPWRILMLTTFLTSSLVIFWKVHSEFLKYLAALLIILTVAINFSYFKPSEYYNPDDNYFLTRFFARDTANAITNPQYSNYSEDYLLLPIWVTKRPSFVPVNKFSSETIDIKAINTKSPVDYSVEVEGDGLLEFYTYYFPGWYAKIDDKPAKIEILKPYGNIGVNVSDGQLKVDVYWQETLLRKVSDAVSVLSGIVILGLFLL